MQPTEGFTGEKQPAEGFSSEKQLAEGFTSFGFFDAQNTYPQGFFRLDG